MQLSSRLVPSATRWFSLAYRSALPQGFSGQLFPLYYDSDTWNPYQKSQQVKVEFSQENKTEPEAMFIAFPAMKALAQKHFGCDTLPGAPADVGSAASHFKQRLFGVSEGQCESSADVSVRVTCQRPSVAQWSGALSSVVLVSLSPT